MNPILRRFFVSDTPKNFTPWFIEFFALACAFGCVDSIRANASCREWASFAVMSLILAIVGFRWSWIKTRAAARWNKWREKKTVVAQSEVGKPQHNVQFTGFVMFADDDFITATIAFRNVPNGKLLGKFEMPRLRVIYYNLLTGEEIADMSPVQWHNDSGDTPIDIGSQEQSAVVGSFFKEHGIWKAVELVNDDWSLDLKIHSVELPAMSLHIIASLSGGNKLQIPDIEGILTLGEDGTASFLPTLGYIGAR